MKDFRVVITIIIIMIEVNNDEKQINISSQKEQLISFEKALTSLQEQLEVKDVIINNINKEKERLLTDLKKYKRANCNLKQQLEDERAYYLKEKEYYCKEMSVNKKIKKNKTEQEELADKSKELDDLHEEVTKLKSVLNETLEANYNLSIKFLRMKNTKYTLKARYKKDQTENAKIISDLTNNLITLKKDSDYIIQEKFKERLSPSNKKYLQVVKQNTQLIYDNLSFQIEISKLCNDIEHLKAKQVKLETGLRLQYAHKINYHGKNSCDKMCEADLCLNCSTMNSNFSVEIKKSSDCTISTTTAKDFDVFSGVVIPLYPKMIETVRTQSAPEFRQQEYDFTEISEFDLENT